MQMNRALALVRLLALIAPAAHLAGGCAGPPSRGGPPNWRESGLASWYGADFHGRRTANGERYNMYAMTAAHKTLPLGIQVLVTHRESGRRIRVRVNDRGPFVAGRIIDLSFGAARALGSVEAGVVPVIVEADLPSSAFAAAPAPAAPSAPFAAGASSPATSGPRAPSSPPPLRGAFAVQIGSFTVEANARQLAARLPVQPGAARVQFFEDNRGAWWRVRIAGYASELEAMTAAAAFEELGLVGYVVRED
jgi:rare lipoprotein A